MSKKYNDDADGKITFQLTQNVSSVSFKHKIKIIVILSIILIIIVSLTIGISISAKKSNEYDKIAITMYLLFKILLLHH